jgi:inorganic triphosphatase YgiF
MPAEIEARFAAATEETLDRVAACERLGPATLGPIDAADEVDRYLDTADGRLATAGWACRLRSRGAGWRVSLKGPPRHAGGGSPAWLHEREEIEGPATEAADPAAWPPSKARDRLIEIAGDAPMMEIVRLLQRRRERAVLVDGGHRGILSVDAVTVVREGREVGRLRVVELELPTGLERTALDPLAAALGGVEGLAPDPRSKLERALAMISEQPE